MESGTPTPTAPRRARKQRSPSYPAIGLKEALGRAKEIYQHEGRHAAPVSAVLAHWGYSAKSSGGRLALAALKKYGLIADEGSREHRQVRLTRLALTIILDEREESADRQRAIREAAMTPTIHQELLGRYPDGLPSDANLRHYLLLDRAFTETAVAEFIPRFRSTIEFAGLDSDVRISYDVEDKISANGNVETQQERDMSAPSLAGGSENPVVHRAPAGPPPASSSGALHRAVQVPLSGAEWVTVEGAFPLSEQAWNQMIAVLNAMKPGLVEPDPD